jgi:hypothetical protein
MFYRSFNGHFLERAGSNPGPLLSDLKGLSGLFILWAEQPSKEYNPSTTMVNFTSPTPAQFL